MGKQWKTVLLQLYFPVPQIRAMETANSSGFVLPVSAVIPVRDLMEINYGVLGRKNRRGAFTERTGHCMRPGGHTRQKQRLLGGESISQVNERCRQAWKEIKPQLTGDAAIVAHGGLLAHFMEQLLGSESVAASTVAHNASITTIEYEPETERFTLVEFDDYRHLL